MWTRIWALLDRWLFGPASGRAGLLGQCRRLLRYPYAVVRDLARGEINLRAMSLVYTTLLSLIPLLAFSFAILKAFGGHHDLESIVYEFFSPGGRAAAGDGAPAAAAPPARHGHRSRALRDGDGVLHGRLSDDPQHARAVARGAHRGAGRRRAVGRGRQDVHGVRRLLDAPHAGVRRIRGGGGGAAVDLFRLADPARGRAAVVLRAEPRVSAARAAAAAALGRGARAALAPAHALRGPCARRRLPALECQSTRGRARAAGHRGRADGHIPRARRAPGRHRAGGAPAGARYPQHPRAGDPRHRAPSGERARRPAPAADPRGRPPARRAR